MAVMENSRLFVRGLPPNLKEEELRTHFSHIAPVTDAKVNVRKRIGYVGYRSPEAAQEALKYYHRSFIRTSKIHVEFAKSIAELRPERQEDLDRNGIMQDPEIANSAQTNGNTKMEEFLETMQPRSKPRLWENEDASLKPKEGIQTANANEPTGESDEEYAPLPKRRKLDRSLPGKDSDQNSTTSQDMHAPEPARAQQDAVNKSISDADWLRKRKGSFAHEDDDAESATDDGKTPFDVTPAVETKQKVEGEPDASSQTDDDLHETPADTKKPPKRAEIDDRRLFVRNISYQTSEDDLRDYFGTFGTIDEVYLPRTGRKNESKGFAYVQFVDPPDAFDAIKGANAKPFQGRLLHVMASNVKRDSALDDYAISQLPHKKQQQLRRKADAATSTFRWNALFMNSDAVMASTAAKLGISKAELLDPTSSSAAVKQTHAESNVIQETKNFFQSNGVSLESFGSRGFSDTVILVKNFSYGTSTEELKQLFENYGSVKRLLMPPAGTMAIVELASSEQARKAFLSLAYRKLNDSVLFLEKAPKQIFDGKVDSAKESIAPESTTSATKDLELLPTVDPDVVASATLFVKNLNFETPSAKLHDVFQPLQGFLSALVRTKPDPKKSGHTLSMGFGFVEFRSKEDAQAAIAAMDGYILDSHRLQLKLSHKGLDAAAERRREDTAKKAASKHTKIIIKNLPFEATRHDVRELFGSYGKLRSIRLPKKPDKFTRGFAFADFTTAKEAQNAMEALAGVHLLGRRLNLEYAIEAATDPEKEIEAMSRKVGRQLEKVEARQLAGGNRKKFTVDQNEEDDVSFD